MKVLVTGARGFIGKNLCVHLSEKSGYELIAFTREDDPVLLRDKLKDIDVVFHLAGENRPASLDGFEEGNIELTRSLCSALKDIGHSVKVIFSSSIQASKNNPYGESKLAAERLLVDLAAETEHTVHIYRLPNVFGKWCKPNYNSVVATFCHNVANDLAIEIHDPKAIVNLAYIDDVVAEFIRVAERESSLDIFVDISPVYQISLADLAEQIIKFKKSRKNLISEAVGTGLIRALYSTYITYLPSSQFHYDIPTYGDQRGVFVEMLKTPEHGQFSFFSAGEGVTRGMHYHHSKTEKFLVLRGNARFKFRNIITNEKCELVTTGEKPQIVETIPGWVHDITNVGSGELIVMLWANEIFNKELPDTIASEV